MQTIKINLDNTTEKEIDLIVDCLKRGQVIAYPTETVYGLGCDARNSEAVKKINRIKGENKKKPLIVLISDFKMLKKYCFVNSLQMEYLKKVWREPNATPLAPLVRGVKQGPITVILKRRPILPAELTGGLNSLALRLPKSDFLIKMIDRAGFPIVSTSLNKKGEKTLASVKNLEKYFKYLPDLAIDAGKCKKAKSSRLIDLRDIKNIKVIRK